MNKNLFIISVCVVVLFVGACGSHRYTIIEPRKKELNDYCILEIRDFKSNLGDKESVEFTARFADLLYKNIMEDRQENPDNVIFHEVVRETDKTDGVLLLDGTVISYEKGSRAKRYFLGFGAGKAYCTIQSVFTDKKTDEQIMKLNMDGELSMGIFGGAVEEAVQGVVEAYLDYFDDYFENQVAKQKDCKKEEIKVVSIPQDIHIDRVSLRKEPIKIISRGKIKSMVAKYDFFDSSINLSGSFDNDFVDNKDGTVTDMATMLMWEKSGSIRSIDYDRSNAYIKLLKRERFAGYSDWRLPTIEELASLLEKGEQKGVHIDSVFNNKQIRCWTVDQGERDYLASVPIGASSKAAWIVNFQEGKISKTWSSRHRAKNYTKAVRSAE